MCIFHPEADQCLFGDKLASRATPQLESRTPHGPAALSPMSFGHKTPPRCLPAQ